MFSCEYCKICKNTLFTEHLYTTASKYEPGKRLPVQDQQLEHVRNMLTANEEDTGATPLPSCLILNCFHTLFLRRVANFEKVVS